MRSKLLQVIVAIGACVAIAFTGLAIARDLADTRVTILVEGRDYFGVVKSDRQRCVNERKVHLIKQVGDRGGGNDFKIAEDTANEDGEWSTGNTGSQGKHYAKVRRIPDKCKADTSRTLRTEF